MKIYYSSMYIEENVGSFEELKEIIKPEKIQLYLDTNICVYLRDFYREPNSIIKRNDNTWNELKNLLRNIETYDLLVDYSLGIEEACRNLSDFEINYEKLNEMSNQISNLFAMDYFQMIQYSKLIKCQQPIKDITTRKLSKMDSLSEASRFQNLLYANYACLLKLFILDNTYEEAERVEKMLEYLEFLDKELDLVGATNLVFGYYFFDYGNKIKKMIHQNKKGVEYKIHALWNASIDLAFPTLISKEY